MTRLLVSRASWNDLRVHSTSTAALTHPTHLHTDTPYAVRRTQHAVRRPCPRTSIPPGRNHSFMPLEKIDHGSRPLAAAVLVVQVVVHRYGCGCLLARQTKVTRRMELIHSNTKSLIQWKRLSRDLSVFQTERQCASLSHTVPIQC